MNDEHREIIQRAVEARRKWFAALAQGSDSNLCGVGGERLETRAACDAADAFRPLVEACVVDDREQEG